jgi:hypothetical protein
VDQVQGRNVLDQPSGRESETESSSDTTCLVRESSSKSSTWVSGEKQRGEQKEKGKLDDELSD